MSDKPTRRSERQYTLTEALQGYRGLLNLSQQGLADLTAELAAEGKVTHGIVQQHISRIEGGASPQEPTLLVLATAIAEALNRDGWDTQPAEILKHLRNAQRTKPEARHVSPEAAELDAILSVITGEGRTLIWASLHAAARAYIETFRIVLAERRARQNQDNTTDNSAG